MQCPRCGRTYRVARTCPTCDVNLLEAEPEARDDVPVVEPDETSEPGIDGPPDPAWEVVFRTPDPAILPLATMALDDAGIGYVTENRAATDLGAGEAGPAAVLLVPADRAGEARRLLADLEQAGVAGDVSIDIGPPDPAEPLAGTAAPAPVAGRSPDAFIDLIEAAGGPAAAALTVDQLDWLDARLARDAGRFYIDAATIQMLAEEGADPALVGALHEALGDQDGVDLRPSHELLFDAEGGERVGVVTRTQLEWLRAHEGVTGIALEPAALGHLEDAGADPELIDVLQQAADRTDIVRLATVRPVHGRRRATDAAVELFDTQQEAIVGTITGDQATWLADRLEPERALLGPPDYCIDEDVLSSLEADGADDDLVDTLRRALDGRDAMFVRW